MKANRISYSSIRDTTQVNPGGPPDGPSGTFACVGKGSGYMEFLYDQWFGGALSNQAKNLADTRVKALASILNTPVDTDVPEAKAASYLPTQAFGLFDPELDGLVDW